MDYLQACVMLQYNNQIAGAHDLERETTPHSCHGVFTDRSISSLNFPQKVKHSFYCRHILTGSKKKYKMAESCEEHSDGCLWIPMKILKVPRQVALQKKVRMKMNWMQAPFRVRQFQKRGRTIASLDRRGKYLTRNNERRTRSKLIV